MIFSIDRSRESTRLKSPVGVAVVFHSKKSAAAAAGKRAARTEPDPPGRGSMLARK